MWQSDRCQILLPILCPGPHLWNVDPAYLVLVVRPMTKMTHWGLHTTDGWQLFWLMVPDGLRCDQGTAEALLAHQAQIVV